MPRRSRYRQKVIKRRRNRVETKKRLSNTPMTLQEESVKRR